MYHGTELAIAQKILKQGFALSYAQDAEGDTEDEEEIVCHDGMYVAYGKEDAYWWAMVRMFEDGIGKCTIPAVLEFDWEQYEADHDVVIPVIEDPAPINKEIANDAYIACFIGYRNGESYRLRGIEIVHDPYWGDTPVIPARYFTLTFPTTPLKRREAKRDYQEWAKGRESVYDGWEGIRRRRRPPPWVDRNVPPSRVRA